MLKYKLNNMRISSELFEDLFGKSLYKLENEKLKLRFWYMYVF